MFHWTYSAYPVDTYGERYATKTVHDGPDDLTHNDCCWMMPRPGFYCRELLWPDGQFEMGQYWTIVHYD